MARTKAPAAKRRPRPSTPPARTDATSVAIERLFAELERDPTNAGTTLVLADALAELGDARAELVHVQHAVATAPKGERRTYQQREAALIDALRGRLLGKLGSHPEIQIEVRLGFARELSLVNLASDDLVKVLASALPSPDGRLLESLHVAWDGDGLLDLGEVFAALAGEVAVPASLRRLAVGNAFGHSPEDRLMSPAFDDDGEVMPDEAEDLRGVLTTFPRLRELALDLGAVPVRLAPLATKNLESLTWITPRLTSAQIEPLGRSVLPELRRFELWIGGVYGNEDGELRDGEEPADDLDVIESLPLRDLEPVLSMLDRCGSLREVVFGHYHKPAKLIARLREHAFLGRIERLGLSQLSIDDPGELIDLMTATPTLKKLVLDNVLAGERTRDNLSRRLGARLVSSWADPPLQFRYITGYE